MFKRILSFLLSVVMVFSMLPMQALAAEGDGSDAAGQTVETTAAAETETTQARESSEETTEETEETSAPETTEETEEPTVPQTTEAVPEETSAVTEPEETEFEETEPAETEPEKAPLTPSGYTEPDSPHYWYVTHGTHSWTENVTVVEPNEDGSYRMYDTTQTFTEDYKELHEVGGCGVSLLSLEEYNDNTYTFTTFEDLETLAAGSYDSWTAAVYNGEYPFTIERSITLPQNLNLRFNKDGSSYEDYASMVIPEGVTFTNSSGGSIRVGDLTVAGTFYVNETLNVIQSLNVTGRIILSGNTLLLQHGASLSGADKVTVGSGGWGPYWHSSGITTLEAIKASIALANSDTSGWLHMIEVNTNSGAITLDGSLTIPSNMQFNLNGSNSFTIPSGCTLTMNADYVYAGAPIAVEGNLVNSCSYFYVWSPMTVGGTYSGTGALYVPKSAFSSWAECISGLDESAVSVTDVSWDVSWWRIRDINGMTRLGTPTDLAWNKRALTKNGNVSIVDAKGHIYWKAAEPDNNQVIVRFYDENDALVRTWNCGFGGQSTNDRSVFAFIESDLDSGTYYFTVTSMSTSSEYLDSAAAVSGKWTYDQTGTAMPKCTNPVLNWPTCSWTAPDAANDDTSYEIHIFYSDTEDGEPVRVEGNFGFTGTTTQIYSGLYSRYGAGWYSFRVRAIPDDISKNRIGEWSEMSNAFYYDPETFAYDETHILKNIQTDFIEGAEFRFLSDPVVLKNDFTVPAGLVLDIGSGGSITVPAGKTLTLNNIQTAIYGGGKLIVESGGKLVVNSIILLYWINGTIEVQDGGTIIFSEDADNAVVEWDYQSQNPNTVFGVPEENQRMVAFLDSDSGLWEDALSAFEKSTCGWSVLHIASDVTLPRDVTAPANSNIYVPEGVTLTISEGRTLTLPKYAQINVDGTLCSNGAIDVYGYMNVYGSVNNNGSIHMMEGEVNRYVSSLMVSREGRFCNYGEVTARPWSNITADGTWEGNYPDNQGGDVCGSALSMTQAQFEKEIAAAKKAGTQYVLNKAVTLTKSLKLDYQVIIGSGGMLNVSKKVTLTVNKGLILAEGADLRILEGGKLVNNSCITSSATSEMYGSLSVYGTYTHGKNASVDIFQDYGTPAVYGIDAQYLTARYDNADEEALLEALTLEGYGYIQVWTNCLDLNTDITIPANVTLIINPTWTDVENGTRTGWVYINSNVTVCGGLIANAYYNGTPCNLEINGNVEIMPGGGMEVYGHVRNNGRVYVELGGSFSQTDTYGGTWTGNGPVIVRTEQYLQDQIKNGATSIYLTEPVVLTKNFTMPAGIYLNILSNGSITVPEGKTLTLNGEVSLYGGALTVEEGGTLNVNTFVRVHENAVVDVQGTANFADNWAWICPYYENGGINCSISGVEKENQALYVIMNTDNEETVGVFEKSDYDFTFMIIQGNVTLPCDMTIPQNAILHVDNDSELTVPNGVEVNNYGEIYVWNGNTWINSGTINNYGSVYVYGELSNSGTINSYGYAFVYGGLTNNAAINNYRVANVYGDLYNNGTINLYESGQDEECFFGVQEHGYAYNGGDFNVNPESHLWMVGTWEGNDPNNLGGDILMGRYAINYDGASLASGQSVTLKVWDHVEQKYLTTKQVTWSLVDDASTYASINAKGGLTVRKIAEAETVAVQAEIPSTGKTIAATVHLYPAVTQLEIVDADQNSLVSDGQTVIINVSEMEKEEDPKEEWNFQLNLHPLDLDSSERKNDWCTWSVSDKKETYAKYDIKDGILTVTPKTTAKPGTVTVKVTFNAGTKKSVSFKLKFGRYATGVTVYNTETELASGGTLDLTAKASPLNADKPGVTWSLKNASDKNYVTLTAAGKLTAKTVYGKHEVILVASSKDGMVSEAYPITIVPAGEDLLTLKYDGKNVTKATVNVNLNTIDTLTLTGEDYATGGAVDVTLTSSKPSVAKIVNGEVVILKKGTATITATDAKGRTAAVTLKIDKLAAELIITGAGEVASGKSIQLKAAPVGSSSKKVTWTMESGAEYAKISSSGKLTANKNLTSVQEVTVRATAKDGSGATETMDISIRPLGQSVVIYSDEAGEDLFNASGSGAGFVWDMEADKDLQLSAYVYPYYGEDNDRNAIQGVTWTSSNKKVATVDENTGLVTCKKAGSVTITATSKDGGKVKKTVKLVIVKKIKELSAEDQTVKAGKSLDLTKKIVFNPTGATNKSLTWEITDGDGAKYVSLSGKGVLKTTKAASGKWVKITATAKDGSGERVTFTVTIQ